MQQVPKTISQKFRSHRNFQRILSGLCMPFQKKLGFRYRLCPLTRSMHSNAIAADNLTAVKVPPVQFALQLSSDCNLGTAVHRLHHQNLCALVPAPSNLSCDARGAVRSTRNLGAAHPWQFANAIAAYREEIQSITRTIASIDVRRPVCSATVDLTVTTFKY